MFKNYFYSALRSFRKNKTNTWISIVGLSVGLATTILIALFILDELKYDQFNTKKERIYRVAMDMGPDFNNPLTPMPLAPTAEKQFPEIEQTARIVKNRDAKALFVYNDKRFYETNFMYADPAIFTIFNFNFLTGDPHMALTEPHTLIINEATAYKYFGSTDAVNKIIHIQGEDDPFKITAVVKDFPPQSHFHFSFLISFSSLSRQHENNWLIPYMFTYLLLKENTPIPALEKKLTDLTIKNFSAQVTKFSGMSWEDYQKKNGHGLKIYLQKLTDIHLRSNARIELETNGNYKNVYLFGIIALFILLLSCVNFINLATASASIRSKEIGVRKVIGALRINLIRQFLFETFLLCFFSMLIALCLVFFSLSALNEITGKEIHFIQVFNINLLPALIGILIVAGSLSGAYPAFYLSSLDPVKAFKNPFTKNNNGISLRRSLIVAQFAISTGLIICVMIVNSQLRFMNNSDLGFQKDQLISLNIHADLTPRAKETIKNNLLQQKSIHAVTMLNYLPGKEAYENQDIFVPQGKPLDQFVPMWYMRGDWDLVKTMRFQIIAGRDFDRQMATDSLGYILNEEAVKKLGWKTEDAVGKTLTSFGNGPTDLIHGHVIAVIKDFHFEDFTHPIKPMLLGVNSDYWSNIVMRVDPKDIASTISYCEKQWKSFQPQYPFEYSFLDQDFARLWASDKKLTVILGIFTIVALGIGCIGLFGLSVFAATRRTKEIGIRKVMGASVIRIAAMLSKEYLILVGIAYAIAVPAAALLSGYWLQNFAYRIGLDIWLFILPGFAAILIALLTVSFRAVKAALANPVKSLRTE